MFAAGYIDDAKISHELAQKSEHFYATIGIHPCRANEPYKRLGKKSSDMSEEERGAALNKYI